MHHPIKRNSASSDNDASNQVDVRPDTLQGLLEEAVRQSDIVALDEYLRAIESLNQRLRPKRLVVIDPDKLFAHLFSVAAAVEGGVSEAMADALMQVAYNSRMAATPLLAGAMTMGHISIVERLLQNNVKLSYDYKQQVEFNKLSTSQQHRLVAAERIMRVQQNLGDSKFWTRPLNRNETYFQEAVNQDVEYVADYLNRLVSDERCDSQVRAGFYQLLLKAPVETGILKNLSPSMKEALERAASEGAQASSSSSSSSSSASAQAAFSVEMGEVIQGKATAAIDRLQEKGLSDADKQTLLTYIDSALTTPPSKISIDAKLSAEVILLSKEHLSDVSLCFDAPSRLYPELPAHLHQQALRHYQKALLVALNGGAQSITPAHTPLKALSRKPIMGWYLEPYLASSPQVSMLKVAEPIFEHLRALPTPVGGLGRIFLTGCPPRRDWGKFFAENETSTRADKWTVLLMVCDVNSKDINGIAALIWAAYEGRTEIVAALLAVPSIDVNAKTTYGDTALIWAARSGCTEIIAALLAVPGIDVNAQNTHGDTALIWAARRGCTEIVAALLTVPGIDVNAKDTKGDTALIEAARRGRTEIVAALLAVPGIDVNAKTTHGDTALIVAASYGHTEIVAALLAVPGIDVNAKDTHGYTALMAAASHGHTEIVAALLAVLGIDVNAENTHSDTALILAACYGHTEIVAALLAVLGIDVNAMNTDGDTALIKAACYGHTETVATLLAVPGIDVNAMNTDGDTALIKAASHGHTKTVATLLADPGIDVNAKDTHGETALIKAASHGHTKTVATLLADPGIDVNAKNTNGETALMVAASYGYTEIVAALLAVPGIDVNAQTTHGNTALIWAVSRGHTEIVAALLAVPGIDVNAKNSDGTSALSVATAACKKLIKDHIKANALSALPSHTVAEELALTRENSRCNAAQSQKTGQPTRTESASSSAQATLLALSNAELSPGAITSIIQTIKGYMEELKDSLDNNQLTIAQLKQLLTFVQCPQPTSKTSESEQLSWRQQQAACHDLCTRVGIDLIACLTKPSLLYSDIESPEQAGKARVVIVKTVVSALQPMLLSAPQSDNLAAEPVSSVSSAASVSVIASARTIARSGQVAPLTQSNPSLLFSQAPTGTPAKAQESVDDAAQVVTLTQSNTNLSFPKVPTEPPQARPDTSRKNGVGSLTPDFS